MEILSGENYSFSIKLSKVDNLCWSSRSFMCMLEILLAYRFYLPNSQWPILMSKVLHNPLFFIYIKSHVESDQNLITYIKFIPIFLSTHLVMNFSLNLRERLYTGPRQVIISMRIIEKKSYKTKVTITHLELKNKYFYLFEKT